MGLGGQVRQGLLDDSAKVQEVRDQRVRHYARSGGATRDGEEQQENQVALCQAQHRCRVLQGQRARPHRHYAQAHFYAAHIWQVGESLTEIKVMSNLLNLLSYFDRILSFVVLAVI